jgi:hypothetical protein
MIRSRARPAVNTGRDIWSNVYGGGVGQKPATGSTHWLDVPGPRLQQNWPPPHGWQLAPHGPSQPALVAGPHPFSHRPLQQWAPGFVVSQSTQLSPHRFRSVFASVVQRLVLNSHCTVLTGHVQKPVDPLHTLSPVQAGSQV